MAKFNDIDLKNWKNSDIWTDSLWLISERDKSGKHEGSYHGNFVPQIPRQLISRYTKKNEIVFDPFVGSGTTAYEAESLKRHFIGVDIQNCLIKNIRKKLDIGNNTSDLILGDSTEDNTFKKVRVVLGKNKKTNVQFAILHPPYADIIKFSDLKGDLSNSGTLNNFLEKFSLVLKNTISILEGGRYLAIVIGDKYTSAERR